MDRTYGEMAQGYVHPHQSLEYEHEPAMNMNDRSWDGENGEMDVSVPAGSGIALASATADPSSTDVDTGTLLQREEKESEDEEVEGTGKKSRCRWCCWPWASSLTTPSPPRDRRILINGGSGSDSAVPNPPTAAYITLDPPLHSYPSNVVRNQKYHLITFLPHFLYEQFSFFFNMYFLLVALSQFIPALQIGFLFTYVAPLVFVLAVTCAKEAWDDILRWRRDQEMNGQKYERVRTNTWEMDVSSGNDLVTELVPSSALRVGDILRLHSGQRVPADVLLLRTYHDRSSPGGGGSIFIRTDQLDGETDWKLRNAIGVTHQLPEERMILQLKAQVQVEQPRKAIYDFAANFITYQSPYQSDGSSSAASSSSSSSSPSSTSAPSMSQSLSLEHTLWSNTVVASGSGSVLVLVIYTGADTRAFLNANKPQTKVGRLDLELNKLSKLLFGLTLVLAFVMTALKGLHGAWLLVLFRFVLLFSSIIPISLRVNLDLSKTLSSYFIEHDPSIPDTLVRTSTIPEELGRVRFLLSDKTGTLTKNVMQFRNLVIGTAGNTATSHQMMDGSGSSAMVTSDGGGMGMVRDRPNPASLGMGLSSGPTTFVRNQSARVRTILRHAFERERDELKRTRGGPAQAHHQKQQQLKADTEDATPTTPIHVQPANESTTAATSPVSSIAPDSASCLLSNSSSPPAPRADPSAGARMSQHDRALGIPTSTADSSANGDLFELQLDSMSSHSRSNISNMNGNSSVQNRSRGSSSSTLSSDVDEDEEGRLVHESGSGYVHHNDGEHRPIRQDRGGYTHLGRDEEEVDDDAPSRRESIDASSLGDVEMGRLSSTAADPLAYPDPDMDPTHAGAAHLSMPSTLSALSPPPRASPTSRPRQRMRVGARPRTFTDGIEAAAQAHAAAVADMDVDIDEDEVDDSDMSSYDPSSLSGLRLQHSLRRAVTALALCHNVTPTIDEDGKLVFQASSPDEVALVEYAHKVGIKLVERTQTKIVLQTPLLKEGARQNHHSTVVATSSSSLIDPAFETEVYEILNLFPFTSESKRMGIIVRRVYENDAGLGSEHSSSKQSSDPHPTGEVTLFVKGAEAVMMQLLSPSESEWLEEEVDNLARLGLRTLVVGCRTLTAAEYDDFQCKYSAAKAALHDRSTQVAQSLASIEHGLSLLGLTGVEDKLQDQVKSTLETIRHAGIGCWMLTGDKAETATCVGISARLIERGQPIFHFLGATTMREAARLLDSFSTKVNTCLVIDGPSLQTCLDSFQKLFLELACAAPAVICARCAPQQKAIVVSLLKQHTGQCVAAVGDGGNDVSMILAADVGVGIVGKEGKQASLAADFSITQFSHLLPLLLWHGRNSYKRTARLSQFVVHRGLIISVLQAVFSALFFFAAVPLFDGWLMVGYATFYTSLPVFTLVLDEDVDESKVFLYPELYRDLQKGRPLSAKTAAIWLFQSVFQGGIIMILVLMLFESRLLDIVAISFTALVASELVNVGLEVHRWHRLMIAAEVCSIIVYLASIFLLKSYFDITFIFTFGFLWKVAFITSVSCLPPAIAKYLHGKYNPSAQSKVNQS